MIIRRPRALLWQLGLVLIGVQAIALLILGWYAMSRVRSLSIEQTLGELKRVTPLLAARYEPLLNSDRSSHEALNRMVRDDAASSGLRITIILAPGTVIADSASDPRTMESHADRPEVIAALASSTGSATRHSTTTSAKTMYYAQRVVVGDQPGVVRAALPMAVAVAEPRHVVRVIAIAALVLFTLTSLAILLVSRRLSATVSRLASGAEQFASGHLGHRVDRPSNAEFAGLADSLNRMAEQLSGQIDMLRDQRSEQQAIYQSMSNGLIALDLDQRIISMNLAAEKLLHLSGQSARGRLLQEVAREPELNRLLEQAVAAEEPIRRELRLSAGRGLTIEAACEPLRNARNQVVGVLLFVNDLTQLRRLESIRSDFAANVSHELRTPITNIKGYVETMLEVGVQDQMQTRKFLEIISRNTARLASIVEDLLALARLEQPSAKATLQRSRHSIKRIVESAANQFEPQLKGKQMRLRLQVEGALEAIVNPQLIEQALCNLLSNAIKYSPPGTVVTVKAEAVNGSIHLAVADQGPGIPAEHLPRLFERFYRVDRARSREMGGTGLGLAIVKHIAQVHGGKVDVQSQVGRGSEFRLTLPLQSTNS